MYESIYRIKTFCCPKKNFIFYFSVNHNFSLVNYDIFCNYVYRELFLRIFLCGALFNIIENLPYLRKFYSPQINLQEFFLLPISYFPDFPELSDYLLTHLLRSDWYEYCWKLKDIFRYFLCLSVRNYFYFILSGKISFIVTVKQRESFSYLLE